MTAASLLCASAAALLSLSAIAVAQNLGEPIDVEFTARIDHSKQRYVLMLPADFDEAKPHDVILAFHGHGSDRWQYARDERPECLGARETAAKFGMIYVCPDYRAKTSWMGPKAEADVVQIIRDLKRNYKVGKVFLVGASMGGTSVLTFAALHPEMVDGVVSENGTANHLLYENFQDAIQESFGGTKQQIPLEYKKRSAEYWPEKLTMPIAFTTGGQDKSVPPDSVLRLASVLKQMGRKVLLIHRPETGHSTNHDDTIAAMEWVVRTVLGLEQKPEGK